VRTATFLDIKPAVCSEANFVELETATGQPMRIYSINRVLKDVCAGGMRPCFVILNNDLTGGIPDVLRDLDVPIYPSMQAGWHARSKAHHFTHLQDVTRELADILSVDPWVLSTLTDTVDAVDIRDVHDRQRVADTAADVMRRVQVKYTEHGIGEKPFIFVKADSGTYGMGVMPIEDPQELLELNNRQRNKLHKGKGAQTIDRFLLQEGVPSVHTVDGCVSEVCIYQITHQFVGGFYRLHTDKSARENLNSKGMAFKTMCPHLSCFGSNTVPEHPGAFDVYRLLARVAGIAAHHEIQHLEAARL
jgi:glutamate--cysteine ligase